MPARTCQCNQAYRSPPALALSAAGVRLGACTARPGTPLRPHSTEHSAFSGCETASKQLVAPLDSRHRLCWPPLIAPLQEYLDSFLTGHEREQLQAAWLVYQHRVAVSRHQFTSATLEAELAAGRHAASWQRQHARAAPAAHSAESSSRATAQVLLLPLLLLNCHCCDGLLLVPAFDAAPPTWPVAGWGSLLAHYRVGVAARLPYLAAIHLISPDFSCTHCLLAYLQAFSVLLLNIPKLGSYATAELNAFLELQAALQRVRNSAVLA